MILSLLPPDPPWIAAERVAVAGPPVLGCEFRSSWVALLVYNATCLLRPHLFYAMFVVSIIINICYIICHA